MSGSVDGTFVVQKIVAQQVEFGDNAVPARAGVHRFVVHHNEPAGSDVAAKTIPIHHFQTAGKVVSWSIVPYTAPTGGDKAYTVDVYKGNQATTPATINTGVVTISSSDANRQVKDGVLTTSPTTCAADDILVAVVAVSGTTGSQGQGYTVSVVIDQDAL